MKYVERTVGRRQWYTCAMDYLHLFGQAQSINRSQQRHVRRLCLEPEEDQSWERTNRIARGEGMRVRERGFAVVYMPREQVCVYISVCPAVSVPSWLRETESSVQTVNPIAPVSVPSLLLFSFYFLLLSLHYLFFPLFFSTTSLNTSLSVLSIVITTIFKSGTCWKSETRYLMWIAVFW